LVFTVVVNAFLKLLMWQLVGYQPPLPGVEGPATIPGDQFIGGCCSLSPPLGITVGLTVYFLAPEAAGHGTDAVIGAFHRGGGAMRKRIPFVKTLATALTLGTGGSAGREGPITHVGSGLGSMVGALFKSSERERRILMLAGAGAGLGAIFRSPLGGALFVTEVLYRDVDFEAPALVPAFIASITLTPSTAASWAPGARSSQSHHSRSIISPNYRLYIVGLICAALGAVYLKTMHWVEDVFHKIRLPVYVKPVHRHCTCAVYPSSAWASGRVQCAMAGLTYTGRRILWKTSSPSALFSGRRHPTRRRSVPTIYRRVIRRYD